MICIVLLLAPKNKMIRNLLVILVPVVLLIFLVPMVSLVPHVTLTLSPFSMCDLLAFTLFTEDKG